MTVLVAPAALEDVDAAARRLEGEHPGYGLALADLFDAAVDAIRQGPRQHPRADDAPAGLEVREVFIRRFDYRVLYLLAAEAATVLRVVHARRRPGTWAHGLPSSN